MKILLNFLWITIPIIFINCTQENKALSKGDFMGMQPTEIPQLLLPELIASPVDEYNGTFSPDGKEFFYTTNTPEKGIITYTQVDEKGNWQKPVVAPFSGKYSEYDPLFSPEGNRLYFTSERPISEKDDSGKTNIWSVEKIKEGWSEPELLELDKTGVYYSSFTKKGTMYFNIWDTGDMYKAEKSVKGYKISALDSVLNSQNGEGDPFISPEEDYLIFRGYNNTLGRGDLYISFRNKGKWTAPENLGEPINSTAHEMCPFVTPDGKFFIFASARVLEKKEALPGMEMSEITDQYRSYDNGNLNIYYVSADFIPTLRRKYFQNIGD